MTAARCVYLKKFKKINKVKYYMRFSDIKHYNIIHDSLYLLSLKTV